MRLGAVRKRYATGEEIRRGWTVELDAPVSCHDRPEHPPPKDVVDRLAIEAGKRSRSVAAHRDRSDPGALLALVQDLAWGSTGWGPPLP